MRLRFPFFDLRLVLYLLRVPSVPWLERKQLLREALAGDLPEAVRQHPKRVLQGQPHFALMQQRGVQSWMEDLGSVPDLNHYVNRDGWLKTLRSPTTLTPAIYNQAASVFPLAYWLRHKRNLNTVG